MVKTRNACLDDDSDSDSEQLAASVSKFVDLVVAKAKQKTEELELESEEEDTEDEEMDAEMYTFQEMRYLSQCGSAKRQKLNAMEAELNSSSSMPFRFQILESKHSDEAKSRMLSLLDSKDNKSRASVEAALKVPISPACQSSHVSPALCAQMLQDARTHLDNAVHGLDCVKTPILQLLAQFLTNPSASFPPILLNGPPGVAKTTIAKSIANALSRQMAVISCGGMTEVATLKGGNAIFEGSNIGEITNAIISKGTNAVIVLDEIDKISESKMGTEATATLMCALDRTQNSEFTDQFIPYVPLDLSQIIFVCTSNNKDLLHPVLKDRLCVIDIPAPTKAEKLNIATKFLIPRANKNVHANTFDVAITDAGVHTLIELSGEEKGVRELERKIEELIRTVNYNRLVDTNFTNEPLTPARIKELVPKRAPTAHSMYI